MSGSGHFAFVTTLLLAIAIGHVYPRSLRDPVAATTAPQIMVMLSDQDMNSDSDPAVQDMLQEPVADPMQDSMAEQMQDPMGNEMQDSMVQDPMEDQMAQDSMEDPMAQDPMESQMVQDPMEGQMMQDEDVGSSDLPDQRALIRSVTASRFISPGFGYGGYGGFGGYGGYGGLGFGGYGGLGYGSYGYRGIGYGGLGFGGFWDENQNSTVHSGNFTVPHHHKHHQNSIDSSNSTVSQQNSVDSSLNNTVQRQPARAANLPVSSTTVASVDGTDSGPDNSTDSPDSSSSPDSTDSSSNSTDSSSGNSTGSDNGQPTPSQVPKNTIVLRIPKRLMRRLVLKFGEGDPSNFIKADTARNFYKVVVNTDDLKLGLGSRRRLRWGNGPSHRFQQSRQPHPIFFLAPGGMNGMDNGMNGMDNGMNGMDNGMNGMDNGMNGMNNGMDGMDNGPFPMNM